MNPTQSRCILSPGSEALIAPGQSGEVERQMSQCHACKNMGLRKTCDAGEFGGEIARNENTASDQGGRGARWKPGGHPFSAWPVHLGGHRDRPALFDLIKDAANGQGRVLARHG